MAKSRGLREFIAASAESTLSRSWFHSIPKADKEEITSVIEEWLDDGEIRRIVPSRTSLARMIKQHYGLRVSVGTIVRTIREVHADGTS